MRSHSRAVEVWQAHYCDASRPEDHGSAAQWESGVLGFQTFRPICGSVATLDAKPRRDSICTTSACD